jgi:peptidoglycan/LPS O-acetylase OafA/YrhL
VLGMSVCTFNVQLKGKRVQGTICGLLFIILSIVVYTAEISGGVLSFAMGWLACVAVILMVADYEEKFNKGMDFLAKYTMPIFLMHTLFAAPMRSFLLKTGIENATIHVVLGVVTSFGGPIIAAWIMKKTNWLEFFLYPVASIQKRNK